MKRLYKISTLLAIVILFSSCFAQMLNPLFTEEELILNDDLVGIWENKESKQKWVFEKVFNKGSQEYSIDYRLTHYDGEERTDLRAGLGKLDDTYFLNLKVDEISDPTQMYYYHLTPVYSIFKIEINKNDIIIYALDHSWLDKQMESKALIIDHVKSEDGQVLITASNAELKTVMRKLKDTKEAYIEALILKKQ